MLPRNFFFFFFFWGGGGGGGGGGAQLSPCTVGSQECVVPSWIHPSIFGTDVWQKSRGPSQSPYLPLNSSHAQHFIAKIEV